MLPNFLIATLIKEKKKALKNPNLNFYGIGDTCSLKSFTTHIGIEMSVFKSAPTIPISLGIVVEANDMMENVEIGINFYRMEKPTFL
jgi:hypothetical protein